jgi:hypothetical protein
MNIASTITNSFQNFHVHNLSQLVHRVEGRGPFIVTQDGAAPDDPKMRPCAFVLTRRGTWLHFYLYLTLPENVRAACAHFDSIADVMTLAEKLSGKPIVEDTASLQDLIRSTGFTPDASDSAGNALLRAIVERHARRST